MIFPYPPSFESLTLYLLKKVISPLPVSIKSLPEITLSSSAAIIDINLKVDPGSCASPIA